LQENHAPSFKASRRPGVVSAKVLFSVPGVVTGWEIYASQSS
jgi:hypothetical protein